MDAVARCRQFFQDQLPRVLVSRAALLKADRGAVCFMIQGAGAWTLSFGVDADAALVEEANLEVPCVAAFSAAAFCDLLDGNAPSAAPVVMGDAKLLSRMGALFLPQAKGGVTARFLAAA